MADAAATQIPSYDSASPTGMRDWFKAMDALGLLFHPDDSPEEVVTGLAGVPTFTPAEAAEVRRIRAEMIAQHGYEAMMSAAYPAFMGREEGAEDDA